MIVTLIKRNRSRTILQCLSLVWLCYWYGSSMEDGPPVEPAVLTVIDNNSSTSDTKLVSDTLALIQENIEAQELDQTSQSSENDNEQELHLGRVAKVTPTYIKSILEKFKNMTVLPFQGLDKYANLPNSYGNNCPFDIHKQYLNSEDFSDIKPLLNSIRRDKFLINLSPFGPNNQFRGFRDAIIFAIYTNRTIVLPPFKKHYSDPTTSRPGYLYQHPSEKVDGASLAKLLPVLPFEKFSEKCSHGLDKILMARVESNLTMLSRLGELEVITGIPVLKNPKYWDYRSGESATLADALQPDIIHSIDPVTRGKNKPLKIEAHFKMGRHDSNAGYAGLNFEDKCVLWLEAYRHMDFTKDLRVWENKKSDLSSLKEYDEKTANSLLDDANTPELAARIVLASSRASEVKIITRKFLADEMKAKNYLSIHWRYDEKDFNTHCKKYHLTGGICGHLKNGIDFIGMANGILSFIIKTQVKIDAIYIAAPPKEAENINKMKEIFRSQNYASFDGNDLTAYLTNEYKTCPNEIFNDQIHDFTSQIEMEICSRAELFIYSKGSSWSKNILMERVAKGVNRNDIENTEFIV